MKSLIPSQIGIVVISEIKKNFHRIKNECFSAVEINELHNKHMQSPDGFYAAKLAFTKTIDQQCSDKNISGKQVILTHNSNGAPYIREFISLDNDALRKFSISISHTSEIPDGFAVITDVIK